MAVVLQSTLIAGHSVTNINCSWAGAATARIVVHPNAHPRRKQHRLGEVDSAQTTFKIHVHFSDTGLALFLLMVLLPNKSKTFYSLLKTITETDTDIGGVFATQCHGQTDIPG